MSQEQKLVSANVEDEVVKNALVSLETMCAKVTVVPQTGTTRVYFDDLTVGVSGNILKDIETFMTIKSLDFKRKMIIGTMKP